MRIMLSRGNVAIIRLPAELNISFKTIAYLAGGADSSDELASALIRSNNREKHTISGKSGLKAQKRPEIGLF
jgi:hypothetical protein